MSIKTILFLFVQIWLNDHNPFLIHGLWPNYVNGSWPQYCSNEQFNITAIKPLIPELLDAWPGFPPFSYNSSVSFWNHEYTKHGTCAYMVNNTLDIEYTFFSSVLGLYKEYPFYDMLSSIDVYPLSKKWSENAVENLWMRKFFFKPIFTCENKVLSDIRMCLTGDLIPTNCSEEIYKDSSTNCYPEFIY